MLNNISISTYTNSLQRQYEYINCFNENFICANVNTITSLYTKDKHTHKWNHPLILNYNYCLFCKETTNNKDKFSLKYSHMKCYNLYDFFTSNKIRFRNVYTKKDKLIKRRMIKSTSFKNIKTNSEDNNNYNIKTYHNKSSSETERLLQCNLPNKQNKLNVNYAKNIISKNKILSSDNITMLFPNEISLRIKHNKTTKNFKKDYDELYNQNSQSNIIIPSPINQCKINDNDNVNYKFNFPNAKTKQYQLKPAHTSFVNNKDSPFYSIKKIINRFTNTYNPNDLLRKKTEPNQILMDLNTHANTTSVNKKILEDIKSNNYDKTEENTSHCLNNKNELCDICLSAITDKFVVNCGDFYCRNCIRLLVLNCINDISKFHNLCCPKEICKEPFDENVIEKLLTEDEYLKYKSVKTRIEGLTNHLLIPCPFPDCNSYAEEKLTKKNIAFCGENHYFCKSCLFIFPSDQINNDNNKQEEDIYEHICNKKHDEIDKYILSNKFIKRCPNCNCLVEREPGGCNNMTCTNIWCNYEFCWICDKQYDSAHYKNPLSMCFGLGDSDNISKYSQYKGVRIAKCMLIFLLLITIGLPIVLTLFSFVVVFGVVIIFITDGATITNIKLKHTGKNTAFTYISYCLYSVLSIGLISFGYVVLVFLTISVPILCIVNKCKRPKEDEE